MASSAPATLLPLATGAAAVRVRVAPRHAPRHDQPAARVRLVAAGTAPLVPAAPRARRHRCARVGASFFTSCAPVVDIDRPARDAVRGAVADVFRPMVDNFNRLRSLKSGLDVDDYNIGMPTGAIIACIGCYQLWKMNPSLFLDAVLGYAFYKLSVLSSEVRKQGFPNEYITRIKYIIAFIFLAKDFHKNFVPLDYIKVPVCFFYLGNFLFEVKGLKKDARYNLSRIFEPLQTKEGRRDLIQILSQPNE